VIRVLAQVSGLRASEVRPQETVVDSDGRSRRIDFAVRRDELKLALEVDGAEKVAGHPGLSGERLDDALRRQNALVAAGWRVLRFSNAQVMSESARCARTIAEQLASPLPSHVSDVPPASPPARPVPAREPESGPSRARRYVAAAVVVGLVVAAGVLAGGDTDGDRPEPPVAASKDNEPTSEAEQRRLDLQRGAVAPASKDDCPASHPVKGNYRPDKGTRLYFAEANNFYKLTDPTSCWKDPASAEVGGYDSRAS
jgi:very-short-patch-repair endonuclease